MLQKITEKILSDRNTRIALLFYRLHSDSVLSIIVDTIDIVTNHCIILVIEITWILIDLNNNLIDNLHGDWRN